MWAVNPIKESKIYTMIDKLIHLLLTFSITTATTKCAFSTMKLIKTSLWNKMDEKFLIYCMTLYIEKEYAKYINSNIIIDELYVLKYHRSQLK